MDLLSSLLYCFTKDVLSRGILDLISKRIMLPLALKDFL